MKFNERYGVYVMGMLSFLSSYAFFICLEKYYNLSFIVSMCGACLGFVCFWFITIQMFPIEKDAEDKKNV